MPNAIIPVPEFDSHPGHGAGARPSLAVRMRTRFRRNRLDELLANGADPSADASLALRAMQLRSPAERTRLANALVEKLGDAQAAEPVTIRSRSPRAELREAADDVLALVQRLRDDSPVAVRGAAMTARLLSDGASPLHRSGGEDLAQAIRAARFALASAVAGDRAAAA